MLSKKKSTGRLLLMVLACSLVFWLPVIPAFASSTDVAGAVTTAFGTYMKPQIKDITNNVILRLIDALIAIAAVVTAIWSWLGYKRSGTFKWELLASLGGGLIVSVTAPLWMWKAIGWG